MHGANGLAAGCSRLKDGGETISTINDTTVERYRAASSGRIGPRGADALRLIVDGCLIILATVASLWIEVARADAFPVAEISAGMAAAAALFVAAQHHNLKLPAGDIALIGLVPVSLILIAVALLARDLGGEKSAWALTWASMCGFGLVMGRVALPAVIRSINGTAPLRRIAVLPGGAESVGVSRLLEAHFRHAGGAEVTVFGNQDVRLSDDADGLGCGELQHAVEHGLIDDIVIVRDQTDALMADRLVTCAQKFPVNLSFVESRTLASSATGEDDASGYRVTSLKRSRIGESEIVLKKFCDMVLAAVLLVILAPMMLAIAIAIKSTSRGPLFFRQERTGLYQQSFNILKFRTLRQADADWLSLKQATLDDPRITPVGRFLRKTCLDELPQLINVCRGEMALVGPRPHAPMTRVDGVLFSEVVVDYNLRHCVRPGVTGLAQVSGFRGPVEDRAMLTGRVGCDLDYIENWSPALDLMILLRTLGVPFQAPPEPRESQSRV